MICRLRWEMKKNRRTYKTECTTFLQMDVNERYVCNKNVYYFCVDMYIVVVVINFKWIVVFRRLFTIILHIVICFEYLIKTNVLVWFIAVACAVARENERRENNVDSNAPKIAHARTHIPAK